MAAVSDSRRAARRDGGHGTGEEPPPSFFGMRAPWWALAGGLALATLLVYWPALHGDFIVDDDIWLTNNPLMKAADGLYRYWFTAEAVDYWPVTGSSFWIEWRLWGPQAPGYHVTNLLLHIVSSLLLWRVLFLLNIPGSFVGALLFALHPVNVESVAWISQRKSLLALLFGLLSVLLFLPGEERRAGADADRPPARGRYGIALAMFLLAMLSKGSVAILPFVLLGLLAWRRPLCRADLLRLAPFFLISAVLVPVNMMFQARASSRLASLPFLERLLGAGAAVWFYLGKALAPVDLCFLYPRWNVDPTLWRWWLPLLGVIGGSLLLLWLRRSAWGKAVFLAWAYYLFMLMPVLGFASISFLEHSLIADHYQQLALIGITALAGAAWATFRAGSAPAQRSLDLFLLLVVGLFANLTFSQAREYESPIKLYEATLARNPNTHLIQNNLGLELLRAKEPLPRALEHLEKAVALRPDYAPARNNLGYVLFELHRPAEAQAHLEEAVRLNPDYAEAHQNLGRVLHSGLYTQDALNHYQTAVRLKPDEARYHYGMASALISLGKKDEARAELERVIELDPDHAEANSDLGAALFESGRPKEAIARYQRAIARKPDFAEAHHNLAVALYQAQRVDESIHHFRETLRLKADNSHAHNDLAVALVGKGQLDEAISHFREALRLDPDDSSARANLDETLGMKAKEGTPPEPRPGT